MSLPFDVRFEVKDPRLDTPEVRAWLEQVRQTVLEQLEERYPFTVESRLAAVRHEVETGHPRGLDDWPEDKARE